MSNGDDLNLSGDFSCNDATVRGTLYANAVIPAMAPTLTLSPPVDPFGPFVNMPAGYVNNYADPNLATHSLILWKGADNQATWLTGIDATGIPLGRVVWAINASESGVDSGAVVLVDENDPRALASLAANRIVTGGAAQEYVCPIGGVTMLVRALNKNGQPRWFVGSENGWAKRSIAQSLQLYPNLQIANPGVPLVGNLNDWNPVGESPYAPGEGIDGSDCLFQDHTLLRCFTSALGATITGMLVAPITESRAYGPIKVIYNIGPGDLTIANLSALSAIENRIYCPRGADLVLGVGEAAWLLSPYPNTPSAPPALQWYVLGTSNTNFPSVTTPTRVTSKQVAWTPAVSGALPPVPAVTSDYDPGAFAVVRIAADPAGSIIDGLVPHGPGVAGVGDVRVLLNTGSGPLIITPELGSLSAAVNQFRTPGSDPMVVAAQAGIVIEYDDVGRWKALGNVNQNPTVTLPLSITPAAFPAANVDDWDPVDAVTALSWQYVARIKSQGAVGTFLRTMNPPHAQGDGFTFLLLNYASAYTIVHGAAAGITGRPFHCPGSVDYIVRTTAAVWITFDLVNNVWRVIAP